MSSLKKKWKYLRKLPLPKRYYSMLMCKIPTAKVLPQSIKLIEKMHLLMQ